MSRRSKRPDPSDPAERKRPARRPLAPLPEVVLARRPVSTTPPARSSAVLPVARPQTEASAAPAPAKRAPRIVSTSATPSAEELERRHLLSRLLDSEGTSAVTRAADAYEKGGFPFPAEQEVLLKLLEHKDEHVVRSALNVLTALLDQQPPIQLPVFEQRLKRLEESAEDAETRSGAAELRRVLRT